MTSNKKYEYEIEKSGDTWQAKVTRKVSAKKRTTSMEQSGFSSEEEAKAWAEKSLNELSAVQKDSNQAQGEKRNKNQEVKRLRSARRAEKTEKAKAAKLEQQETQEAPLESDQDSA